MNVFPRDLRARLGCRLLSWFSLIVWIGACLGCAGLSRSILTTPRATATQTGPAEIPASVTTETTTVTIPAVTPNSASHAGAAADAGPGVTRVTPDVESRPGRLELATPNLASGSVVIEMRRDTATAARTYPPPSPPTAAQLAQADGVRWFYVASLVCFVVAGLLAWRAHILAAVKVAAAGVALPLLAHFFSNTVALTVAGALFAAGVAFFAAWHILNARGVIRSV